MTKEKSNFIIISVILTTIFAAILPQTVIAQQGGPKVLVVGDTIHELDLKATQNANGQVSPISGFAINPESVVQVKQGQNILVFTTPTGNEKIEKVKVTNTEGKITELLPLQNNQWSLSGLSIGAYVLDVIVNTSNGKNAYETVLTIIEPNHRPLTKTETTYIVNQLGIWIKVDLRMVFEDNATSPPPQSPCYFDPTLEECKPKDGNCPPGFGFNEDEQCIPHGKCPDGYGRLDDDETGKCYPKNEVKTCPSGYIAHKDDECPPNMPPVEEQPECGEGVDSAGLCRDPLDDCPHCEDPGLVVPPCDEPNSEGDCYVAMPDEAEEESANDELSDYVPPTDEEESNDDGDGSEGGGGDEGGDGGGDTGSLE
ncbi:hypothetical protein BH18THE2_BH18THE2_14570 [soil metagenome]